VHYDAIPEEVRQYIKREILTCIGDAHLSVRRAVSSLITTFVLKGGLEGWPGLLETLVQCLDSQDYNTVEGAFNALLLICEDYSQKLDSDQAGRPLNVLVPKFLTFFKSPHENLRKYAISCVNHFLVDMPAALLVNMETYLQVSILCVCL
jgi:transportin-1